MDLAALEKHLQTYFNDQARTFDLQAGRIRVAYVLNWGGFVNYSFTINDGRQHYHLKLAQDDLADFYKWRAVHRILENRYHAPKLVDWVAIPDTPLAGLLFKHIDGQKPDLAASPALLTELLALIARLHADQGLAARLGVETGKTEVTCRH